MGFRAIERATGVNHNTVINWVKQAGINLSDAPEASEIPEVTQVDELETFVGKKPQNLALDGCKQSNCWDCGLGIRRQKCRNV